MPNKISKSLFVILFTSLLSGCACMNSNTAFGLDGKAVGWCERRNDSEKLCREHGGVKQVSYREAICNDGSVLTEGIR